MTNDELIIAAYIEAAGKTTYLPRKTLPRVLRIDGRNFVMTEIESKGFSFNLILAEAFPNVRGWAVELRTQPEIEAQVRVFVAEHQAV